MTAAAVRSQQVVPEEWGWVCMGENGDTGGSTERGDAGHIKKIMRNILNYMIKQWEKMLMVKMMEKMREHVRLRNNDDGPNCEEMHPENR